MSKIEYKCPECGKTHYLKYKDSDKCSKCLMPTFHATDLNLSKLREKDRISNVLYAKNWVKKKKKT